MTRLATLAIVLGLGAGTVLTTGCLVRGQVRTGAVLYVEEAPPAPRYERVIVQPGHVWISGRWVWTGGRWDWRGGYHERARAGHTWVGGNWQRRGNRHVWVDGSWRAEGRGRVKTKPHKRGRGGPVVHDHRN